MMLSSKHALYLAIIMSLVVILATNSVICIDSSILSIESSG